MIDLAVIHNFSSCEIKAWKNIQAWTGFEPMTSAILVTVYDEDCKAIYETSYIWAA